MKKIFGLTVILAGGLLMAAVGGQADQAAPAAGTTPSVSQPTAATTPAVKAKKAKKAKKAAKKEAKAIWVCPMGDYSGPKTADGKCPKCGMDLVEQK
jgi:hypothetical protein